jgi:hypothetical protein
VNGNHQKNKFVHDEHSNSLVVKDMVDRYYQTHSNSPVSNFDDIVDIIKFLIKSTPEKQVRYQCDCDVIPRA